MHIEVLHSAISEKQLKKAWNERWAAHADVTWIGWSNFDTLTVNFADGITSVQPEFWENSMRYAMGITFRTNNKWTLRVMPPSMKLPNPVHCCAHRAFLAQTGPGCQPALAINTGSI